MDGTAAAREDGLTAQERRTQEAAAKAAADAAKAAAKAQEAAAKAEAAKKDPDAPPPGDGSLAREAIERAEAPATVLDEQED
jgi:hypothetical protein